MAVCDEEPPYSDCYVLNEDSDALPREWCRLVLDDPRNTQTSNRRQLEVVGQSRAHDVLARLDYE